MYGEYNTISLDCAIHVGCSGKYRTEDKLKTQKIHTTPNGSVVFYDNRPGNMVGLH